MGEFKNEIVRFSEPKTRGFFPESFSNEIYFSDVKDFSAISYTSNFSIKYVINGYERYKVGNRHFNISEKQYLLVNDQQEVWSLDAEAKAVSIFINKDLVCDVLDSLTLKEETLLDSPFECKNADIHFFEHLYSNDDVLGRFIEYFQREQSQSGNFNINEELFYVLAERLLVSQLDVRNTIDQLSSIKYATRSELYRRILLAKEFIQSNLYSVFNLDLLSEHCGLSKYHLLRTFKTIFHATPYNYYLKLKVEKSTELLRHVDLSITHIAEISGFNDIYSYSKRFKAVYGITPLEYRRRSSS